MAIINNNVQNVKFLRNQNPFESREAARQALENNKTQAADGTALLARYTADNDVKTLVGFVAEVDSTKYVTIFDTEGASGDVEKLRQEINAKLGTTFISSGNTVESNLTALSGGTFVPGTSSSANTSVEGAKAYAYDLLGTLDYEDTAVAGQYVSQVTQSDGKIAVTRVELPSSADTAVAKKFVTSVAEDKGQIVVSRGEISSTANTMVLTDNADGGVNFEVNIDNDTIIQDAETKKLKVADTALVQYVGDEDTIHISAVDAQNNKTVSSLLTIKEVSTGVPDTVAHRYMLAGTGTTKIGEYIDIPKDSALVNFYLGHVDDLLQGTTAQTEESTSSTVVPGTGDTALVWIMQLSNGNYKLTAVDVHSFIDETEFASGVTWDSTAKKVKGVVDSTSEKDSQDTPVDFLTVGEDGFKISGIKAEIDRKLAAIVENLDATVTGATSGNHITISIEELDGKLVQNGLTIEENDIASATDLAALSAKTVTNITSTNSSIAVSTANTSDDTVEVDVITDADKIQMSGFTTTTGSPLSSITEGDSIATAFEKLDGVIAENERVTAEALTDLDDRIETVSGDVETIKTNYISGASVNGSAVTVSNNSIALSINSAASTGAASSPITVTTAQGGGVTLTFDNIDCGYYDGTQG